MQSTHSCNDDNSQKSHLQDAFSANDPPFDDMPIMSIYTVECQRFTYNGGPNARCERPNQAENALIKATIRKRHEIRYNNFRQVDDTSTSNALDSCSVVENGPRQCPTFSC